MHSIRRLRAPLRTTVCATLPGGHHAPTRSQAWEATPKNGATTGFFALAWARHLRHQQKTKPGGSDVEQHGGVVTRSYLFFYYYF